MTEIDFSDWTDDELRSLLAHRAVANGWGAPGMECYDHYGDERPTPTDGD